MLLGSIAGALALDLSGDGLRAGEDLYHGTDPFKADTLGNGLTDYDEIHVHGTDPLSNDTLGNGLTDYDEIHVHGTDPLSNDTTGDGLSDYDEIYEYETDPTVTDTTGDGLSDYDQIYEYETNPLTNDTTGDGLTDYDQIYEYETNPLTNDTTGDGLSDYAEVNEYGTDPTATDTTGDGLSDYDQIYEYETDPLTNDTTGDGLTDYEQIMEYETDPLTNDTTGDGLTDYVQIHEYDSDPLTNNTLENGIRDVTAVEEYGFDPTSDRVFTSDPSRLPDHELIHHTFPLESTSNSHHGTDSSNDGFSNDVSESNDNLTTDEMDVVIQVSYMEGVEVRKSALLNVQQAFAEAPVEDANGYEAGINLHFYIEEEPVSATTPLDYDTYRNEYYGPKFDSGYGAFHVLIADTVELEGDEVGGFASRNVDGMVVGDSDAGSQYTGGVLMHEIGHQVGLWPEDFQGIDSESISFEEYPSVMNYNKVDECPEDVDKCYQFSDGGAFNDWEHIEENLAGNAPSMRNL